VSSRKFEPVIKHSFVRYALATRGDRIRGRYCGSYHFFVPSFEASTVVVQECLLLSVTDGPVADRPFRRHECVRVCLRCDYLKSDRLTGDESTCPGSVQLRQMTSITSKGGIRPIGRVHDRLTTKCRNRTVKMQLLRVVDVGADLRSIPAVVNGNAEPLRQRGGQFQQLSSIDRRASQRPDVADDIEHGCSPAVDTGQHSRIQP
jgi:hypothetical protein